jgi:hypothetical protein
VGEISEGAALELVLDHAAALLTMELPAPSGEAPPPPSQDVAHEIEGRLRIGLTANPETKNEPGLQDIHLGIDFGTSCIKCAAFFPYQAGEPVVAVPAPGSLAQEKHAYLWPSAVWVSSDAEASFSLYDRGPDTPVAGIKNRLIVKPYESDNPGVSPSVAAAALLALHLRQMKGHLVNTYPAYFEVPRAEWTVNFGYPASSLDDDEVAVRFQRCCAAALDLERSGKPISIETVTAALDRVASSYGTVLEEHGSGVVPEMTAAVSGFAHAGRFEDGLFGLVDIGGMTVDCCTFNLIQKSSGDIECPIFEADVLPLGVEVSKRWREVGGLQRHFRQAVQGMAQKVIWATKRLRYPSSPRWKSGLPVFVVGGGIASKPHKQATANLDAWYRSSTKDTTGGGIEVAELSPPSNLQHELCSDDEAQRLLVAIGLARPAHEILKVAFPREIDDMNPKQSTWLADSRFVGKELT